jgi:hypothetical protein
MTTNPFTLRSFDDLCEQQCLIFRPERKSKWRLLYPNRGELDGFPHFHHVLIIATDGVEALYHVGPDELFRGHLHAFNGPVAKEYVDDEDWDFAGRKRRVKVFRRADKTYAIIPQDSFWDSYWAKHSRMSKDEVEVWAKCVTIDEDGQLCRGELAFEDVDAAIAAVNTKKERPKGKMKVKSEKELVLERL